MAPGTPSLPPVATKPPRAVTAAIKAFVKAVRKHDLMAMAALVIGGNTQFDYGKCNRGVFCCVRADCTGIKVDDFEATVKGGDVSVDFTLDEAYSDGGVDHDAATANLRRVKGSWKIVPPATGDQGDDDFAFWVDEVARPEQVVKDVNSSPTVNRSDPNARLGLARAKLFEQALRRHEKSALDAAPPYFSGYSTMFGAQHTTILWPLGSADEVFFFQTNGADQAPGGYMTCWKRVAGRPQRIWQVRLAAAGNGAGPPSEGTLARWLRDGGGALGKRAPGVAVERLRRVEAYAAYAEEPEVESLHCWIVHQDASEAPDEGPVQAFNEAMRRGFFITPEESRAQLATARR
jgi:hypothetical protein